MHRALLIVPGRHAEGFAELVRRMLPLRQQRAQCNHLARAGQVYEAERQAALQTPRDQMRRGFRAPVVQAVPHVVCAKRGAAREQQIRQSQLYAGRPRVRTGDHESQRVRATAVQITSGVDIGAGVEQVLGNGDNVGRSALPEVFHAVRRDVVQQCGAVFPIRSRLHQ
ncbi:MAG: hypothetical protein IBJ19_00705 [Gemmatimonadaceae bacterium]|nr:hypothetical protein [Gemmatimonadaceae bacterium]